jgi:hypothetical protein
MLTESLNNQLKYTNDGTYIYRLRNNVFIHTTCFDPNGSSSGGAFSYTSLVIELQRNIRTFTLTYIYMSYSDSFGLL